MNNSKVFLTYSLLPLEGRIGSLLPVYLSFVSILCQYLRQNNKFGNHRHHINRQTSTAEHKIFFDKIFTEPTSPASASIAFPRP